MRAIQLLLSTFASADYYLLRYYASRWTPVEFFFAMAIPAIGNGRPKQPSARELKGVVSRVVEVEWAKFTLDFTRARKRAG